MSLFARKKNETPWLLVCALVEGAAGVKRVDVRASLRDMKRKYPYNRPQTSGQGGGVGVDFDQPFLSFPYSQTVDLSVNVFF